MNSPANHCNFLLFGYGRLGRHLEHYFQLLDIHVDVTSGIEDEHLQEKIERATVFLCAVPDDVIESLYTRYAALNKPLVHFSGCFYHPHMIGMHPLMTFSHTLYSKDFYEKIPFVTDVLESDVRMIFPFLKNKIIPIQPKDKVFYHALCTIAGNFPMMLWQHVLEQFKTLNISNDLIALYLRQSLENCLTQPNLSLTGPFVRNDQKTIAAHKKSLQNAPLEGIYEAFEQFYKAL